MGSSRHMGYGNVCRSTGKDMFGTFHTAEKDTYGTTEKDTFGK